MTAREMFERIGYERNADEIGFYVEDDFEYLIYDEEGDRSIKFWAEEKKIELHGDDPYEYVYLKMEDLKAIIKQCEELGWLE